MNTEKKTSYVGKFKLSGKVALVTGGSRGIGRGIALTLAEAGADIVLASRKLPDLEAVAQEVTQLGRKALPVAVNIRHIEELDGLVAKAMDGFGHIDILVNNAGTNVLYGPLSEVDEKVWDVIMGLNLKSIFFLSQAVGKAMRDGGGGSIINIASDAGIRPYLGMSVYSISKAGVIMLTQAFAQEWGQYNIRVNAIAPSVTRTRLSTALWEDETNLKRKEDNTALGRIAEPEEMAGAALYLASEASSYMTGQTLVVDGGHYCSIRSALKTLPGSK